MEPPYFAGAVIFRAAPGVAKKYLRKRRFYTLFKFYNLEILLSVSSPFLLLIELLKLSKNKNILGKIFVVEFFLILFQRLLRGAAT